MSAKKQKEPSHIIRLFVEEAAPVLKDNLIDRRCLNATRVCLEVMAHFNVSATPIRVDAMAINQAYVEKARELGSIPQLSDMHVGGPWSIGVDTADVDGVDQKGGWPGHLVAIVQDCIVDASAIQFNRPRQKIYVPEIFVGTTTPRFLKGKESVVFPLPEGGRLNYRAILEDPAFCSWIALPGFQLHEQNYTMVLEIIDRMHQRQQRSGK